MELLEAAAVFGMFAAVYFLFPRIFRREMGGVLAQIHFWISALAVVLEFALTYWLNLTFHARPGQSGFESLLHALGTSMEADVWAIQVFILAQIIFITNFFWSVFKGRSVEKDLEAFPLHK